MASAHQINMTARLAKALVEKEDFAKAAEILNTKINSSFDPVLFTPNDRDMIIEELEMAWMFTVLHSGPNAIYSLAKVRKMLEPIFIKNLLFVNRFFKENADIGTLSELPDLVKFEIHKIIYTEI